MVRWSPGTCMTSDLGSRRRSLSNSPAGSCCARRDREERPVLPDLASGPDIKGKYI